MDSVFIVEAGVEYEGSTPLRAFGDADQAEDFARQCREYHATRPAWPGNDASSADITKWSSDEKAWAAAHPGGDVGSPNYFTVIEIPFGSTSQPSLDEVTGAGKGDGDA